MRKSAFWGPGSLASRLFAPSASLQTMFMPQGLGRNKLTPQKPGTGANFDAAAKSQFAINSAGKPTLTPGPNINSPIPPFNVRAGAAPVDPTLIRHYQQLLALAKTVKDPKALQISRIATASDAAAEDPAWHEYIQHLKQAHIVSDNPAVAVKTQYPGNMVIGPQSSLWAHIAARLLGPVKGSQFSRS